MSVKIRAGRMIPAPLGRVYEMLLEARKESVSLGRSLQIAWMAKTAAGAIDRARLKGEEAEHPLHRAWCELLDRTLEIRKTMRRDADIDFQFELWLWPLTRQKTLIHVHTERSEFMQWFDALPFVRDYAYWDDTDPDENVDPRAWRARERDWQKVWPVGSSASDRCLNMVMFNHETPMPASADEAMPHIPAIGTRLSKAAMNRHIDEAYRARVEAELAADPDWKPDGFGIFFEAERAARADTARRAAITDEISPMIREIAAEDLSGKR